MTPRELLGNDAINALKQKGYNSSHIRAVAKNLYTSQKEEIQTQTNNVKSDAKKMDNDLIRFSGGITKGALEGVRGTMKIAEDVTNFLDPHRASATNGKYSAPVQKMGTWIKRLEEYQGNYKKVNPESWDVASFSGEMVGGFVDPINIIPLGAASIAKRVIGLAVTGAASGATAAYGGERNVVEGALIGAIATPVIGEGLHQGVKGLAKLWGKQKDRRIASAQNSKDLEDINSNELFDGLEIMQRVDGGEDVNINVKESHGSFNSFFNEVMHGESKAVREQVYSDLNEGKTKSVIDKDRYADLNEFTRYINTLENIQKREPSLSFMEAELSTIREQISKSGDDSALRYNEMLKTTQSEIKTNPSILPTQLKNVINAKLKPSHEEVLITNWVNDGAPVENRLAGWNVMHAIEQDIINPLRTPDEYLQSLQKAGFGEEQSQVFVQAYANQDVSIAKQYFNEKITIKGSDYVVKKGEEFHANQDSSGDVELPSGETKPPRKDELNGDGPQGGRSDEVSNQEHPGSSDANAKRALLDDGQNLVDDIKKGELSKKDGELGGQQTSRGNNDELPSDRSDTVVRKEDESNLGNEKGVENGKDELHTSRKSDEKETFEDETKLDDRPNRDDFEKEKKNTHENVDLHKYEPIELTKAKRKEINNQVDEIIKKDISKVTPEDKEVLRKYTGVGGIEKGTYGSLSEHYTPYKTVRGIYDALNRAGVKFKKALEPAVGSGNFVGHSPKTKWTTIDTDPKAYEINRRLYPDAKHYNTSFEQFKGDGYDLVISNVPFIETRGKGSLDVRPDIKALHDYYFVSAVDKVKDDGVVTFVTSRGTMDKASNKIRKELMSKADIIGAYRLPEGTFSKNAHTDVGVDVIFLQKRKEGVEATPGQLTKNQSFMRSTKTRDGIYLNEYYQAYPQKILGDMEVGVNKQFGGKAYQVSGEADYSKIKLDYRNPKESLHVKEKIEHMQKAPEDSHEFWNWADEHGYETHGLDERGLLIEDGSVRVVKDEVEFSDIDGGAKVYKDISSTDEGKKISLLSEILQLGEKQDLVGKSLIKRYKSEFGVHPYKDKKLGRLFEDIGERESLYEFGSYFDKDFKPAQIFDKKTKFEGSGKVAVSHNAPISTRMLYHENHKGEIDIASKGTYIKEGDFYNALESGYSIHGKGKVQNDILYYSGNLYGKLDDLNKLSDTYKEDGIASTKLEKQRALLEDILPEKKSIEEISLRGDEPWILENDLHVYSLKKVERILDKGERKIHEWKSEFGEVYDNYLNNKTLIKAVKGESLTAYRRRLRTAQEEVQEVLNQIKEKVLTNDKLRLRIEDVYNRKFNGYVSPDYKKASYMIQEVLDELPHDIKLRENQIEWITRALYEGKNINAHDVGGGKTLAGAILARALKKRGVLQKPLFVVPSKVLINWSKEIKSVFPDAKIINLFNLEKKTRSKKLYELGNAEADYVLISQEGFKELQLPWKDQMRYVDELFSENLKTENLKGRALALQQEKIKKYKEVLRRNNKDKRITIDKLGIDAIFADEARAFKNVGVHSKLVQFKLGKAFGLNITEKGSVSLDSAKAYDFRFKTRYISEKNNGRNVFMLDATPTPNKPMEIYTMLKHLDNKIFDEYGIYSDRDFANRYFEFGVLIDKRGEPQVGLTHIKNAYELRSIMDRYVERISMSEFKKRGIIELPDEKVNTHYVDASDESVLVFSDIKKRILEAKSDATKRNKTMGIYSEGVSASTDPRAYQRGGVNDFINPTPQNHKVEAIVEKVLNRRKETKRAGQIIFLDNAGHEQQKGRELDDEFFPATLEKNLHQEIKDKLMANGFDAKQIAIISGKEITNPSTGKEIRSASGRRGIEMKDAIVEAYDAGSVKVIIGTTKGAGEAMNTQKFTRDIHHADIPWTQAEIDQRNGRGVRNGNENDLVDTHYYFQAGTFDELMYRTVTKKRGWNEALWDADVKDRIEIADEGNSMPSEEEFMLQMEKDPLQRRKLELNIEYGRLEDEFTAVQEESHFLKSRKKSLERSVELTHGEINSLKDRAKSDRPNKYLGELLEKIIKTKDTAKQNQLQVDYDTKLPNARANIEKMISAKQKKLKAYDEAIVKTEKHIEENGKDIVDAHSRLESFESLHVNNEGHIKTELEQEAC